jgi:hypothetical protein
MKRIRPNMGTYSYTMLVQIKLNKRSNASLTNQIETESVKTRASHHLSLLVGLNQLNSTLIFDGILSGSEQSLLRQTQFDLY